MINNQTKAVRRSGEPTTLDRIENNQKTVEQLRSQDSDDAPALAETINNCRARSRCMNGACQICGAAVQRLFVKSALSLWPRGTKLVHITIIPRLMRRSVGSLGTIDLSEVKGHLSDLLRAAEHSHLRGIAFIDLCHAIDKRSNSEAWYPHYHMAAAADDTSDLTENFRAVLPPTREVRRPILRVQLNDPDRQLHYMSKPRPSRVTRFDRPGASVHPLKQWLKPREHIEAALWLGRSSVLERIIVLPNPRKAQSGAT